MKLHILTKIRISFIIIVSAGLFWTLCKGFIFNNNGYPQTFWYDNDNILLKFIMINVVCAATTIAAFFLGGKNTRYIAPLAAPFALLLPAVFTKNMDKLLVTMQTGSSRSNLFTTMAIEAVLWYIPVLIGLGIVVILNKKFTPKKIDLDSDSGEGKIKFTTDLPKCIISLIIATVISIIVLPYLCQGDIAELYIAGTPYTLSSAVSIGQQAFAVTATFFLAVMATHQLLGSTGKAFIPLPIIVACFFYLKGNNSIWDEMAGNGVPPHLIHPGLTTLTILPITYAVFGSFGIAWGYWNSYKLHYARENNLIQVK